MKLFLLFLLFIGVTPLWAQISAGKTSMEIVYFVNAKDCISCLAGIRQDFNEVAANNSHEIHTNVDSATFAQVAKEYQLELKTYSIVGYKKQYNLTKSGFYAVNSKKLIAEQSEVFYKKDNYSLLEKDFFKHSISLPETHSLLSVSQCFSTESIAWYSYSLNRAFQFHLKDSSISVFQPTKASLADFKKFDTSLANPNNEYILSQIGMDKVYINGLSFSKDISHYFLVNMLVEIKGSRAQIKGFPFYIKHQNNIKDTFKINPIVLLKGVEYYYEPSSGMVFLNDTVIAALGKRNNQVKIMKGFFSKDKEEPTFHILDDFKPFKIKQEFQYSNGIMLVDNKSMIDAKGNLLFKIPSKFRKKGWYSTSIHYFPSEALVKVVFRNKHQFRLLTFSLSDKGKTYYQRNYQVAFAENFFPGLTPSGNLFLITDNQLYY